MFEVVHHIQVKIKYDLSQHNKMKCIKTWIILNKEHSSSKFKIEDDFQKKQYFLQAFFKKNENIVLNFNNNKKLTYTAKSVRKIMKCYIFYTWLQAAGPHGDANRPPFTLKL